MAKVIIFGNTLSAELAHYYLTNDSEHQVVAFSVHEQYLNSPPEPESNRPNIPMVAFENIESIYPPNEYQFFAPLTEKNMNRFRAGVYDQIKEKGYKMISYISSKATVLTDKIGDNCFILEDNTIQPFVTIGNNCVLWSGNHIGHHGTIGNHVFFTSHVVLSGRCIVGDYCFFGVNATIRDHSIIAEGTLVAMGSNLTKQKTEPWSIWKGNPAEASKISSKDIKI